MRISKRFSTYIAFSVCILYSVLCTPAYAQIGMPELGDSLMAYTGFSTVWAPKVKIKNMRVSGNTVTLHTNSTLRDYRWTPENIDDIRRKVSLWVLGHDKGKVTIYSGRTDISTLITDCARITATNYKSPITNSTCSDLTNRNIVLYPSHGLYFNRDRNEWIWQRATLWTTVEDLYSQEYVRHIRRMLENAGATVYSPRPGLDQQQPGISGMPQWTEAARYWLIHQQADSTLWDLYEGNEYKDDMKCRAMWVNSLTEPIDLCLALHTDGLDSGDDTTIVGTLAIYTARDDENRTALRDGRDRERTNRNLADWIQTQVIEDLRTIAPEWTRRQLKEANYCESRVPVVPSIILELLSHKNLADMKYGLDPNFRFAASRAVYKGILRYLNGPKAVVQPMPVKDLGIQFTNDQSPITNALLQWIAPVDTLEPSATPSYYMVYIRADEGEWDVQQVETTQLAMNLQPGVQYTYYVVAGNEGGLSYPSPTVSAYLNEQMTNDQLQMTNDQPVLIIDAFDDVYGPSWFTDSTYAGIVPGSYACEDGFTCAYIGEQWDFRRADLWQDDDNCGWGACYRDHAGQLTVGNTRDWSVRHGTLLRQMNRSYCSCTAGYLTAKRSNSDSGLTGEAGLTTQCSLLDIVSGRNRVPLSDELCALLADYLDHGGRLLFSTDHLSALDPQWTKRYLHASFAAAQATRSGKVQLRYEGASKRPFTALLAPNDAQLFTDHPEGLKPEGATVWATYMDMRVPAAVGYPGSTLVFGFPIETTLDFDRLYTQAITWLLAE